MSWFDEGPLVAGRTCPQCHDERLRLVLATDEALFLRCDTCGCEWHESAQRVPVRIRLRRKPSVPEDE